MDDAVSRVESKLQGLYDSLDPEEKKVLETVLALAAEDPEVEGYRTPDGCKPGSPPHPMIKEVRVLKVANFVVDVRYVSYPSSGRT